MASQNAWRCAAGLSSSFALLAAAAGCGGAHHTGSPTSTSSATSHATTTGLSASGLLYEQKMRVLGASLGAFIQEVGSSDQSFIQNATTEQSAATLITQELTRLQARLRAAAARLEAIKPPGDVRSPHEQLRQGVLEYARELDGIKASVRGGNFAALKQISTLKGVMRMERASNAISAKGYSIQDP